MREVVLETDAGADAGVRAEQVDMTERFERPVDERGDSRSVADVDLLGPHHRAPLVSDGLGGRTVDIGDHDGHRALGGEAPGQFRADAAPGPGHDHNRVAHVHGSSLPGPGSAPGPVATLLISATGHAVGGVTH